MEVFCMVAFSTMGRSMVSWCLNIRSCTSGCSWMRFLEGEVESFLRYKQIFSFLHIGSLPQFLVICTKSSLFLKLSQTREILWQTGLMISVRFTNWLLFSPSTKIDSHFWKLPHRMATSRRCWCDNDAAACHSLGQYQTNLRLNVTYIWSGIILPWYIVEVTIQKQEGIMYVAEDGEAYIRKHGMTEQ